MDLAPCLFSQVGIIRDPGYNVAYWNLSSRQIGRVEDSFTVNGEPLYFFHFSGFDPGNPGEFSRHQNRFRFSSLGAETKALALQYRDDVLAAGFEECRRWPYAYGRFANGLLIADRSRSIHHESQRLQGLVEDPFSEEGFWSFVDSANQPTTKEIKRIKKPTDPIWIRAEWEKPELLNQVIAGDGKLKLTRLAQIIYEARPEVQRAFPDPSGRDSVRFLMWILTYGKIEHRLAKPHLEPLRSQWDSLLGSPSARLWHRFLLAGMSTSIRVRKVGAAVSRGIGRTMESMNAAVSSEIGLMKASISAKTRRADLVERLPDIVHSRKIVGPFGLNLVGYVRSEMGVGESSRAASRSAKAVGIPVALRDIPTGDYRSEDHSAGPTASDFPYAFNVFHVNADQSRAVVGSLDPLFSANKYNIGFWHWELEQFPDRWLSAFDPYQEIWTSSTFCQEAIARKSPIPVVQIPHSISFEPPPRMGRVYFGLPSGRFLFLTLFDMMSVFDRKNPLAVVEAFIKAFGNDPSVQLVVKINNGRRRPDHLKTLTDRIAGYPITIIDCTFTREETYALMNSCDCLISLHRSEGFGLTLAEAMFLGKPVIATAYSGNMDFTRFDNSFLVGYRLKPVGQNNEPYDQDVVWADPLVEHAAEQMRTVYCNPQTRRNVAVAGQEFIRRQLSPEAVGRLMLDRLQTLHARSDASKIKRPDR